MPEGKETNHGISMLFSLRRLWAIHLPDFQIGRLKRINTALRIDTRNLKLYLLLQQDLYAVNSDQTSEFKLRHSSEMPIFKVLKSRDP